MYRKAIILIIIGVVLLVGVSWLVVSLRSDRAGEYDKSVTNEMLQEEARRRTEMEHYEETLAARNPLLGYLPYISEEFEVHYGVKDRSSYEIFYEVVLHAPSGLSVSEKQAVVEERKSLAVSWITSKGVDIKNLDTTWIVE